jgi:hypothetical protein
MTWTEPTIGAQCANKARGYPESRLTSPLYLVPLAAQECRLQCHCPKTGVLQLLLLARMELRLLSLASGSPIKLGFQATLKL